MPSPKNSSTLHGKLMSNNREIQARGAVTIVIAEEADEAVRPYADHLIEIPAVSMLFQPLLCTITVQMFAASLAQGSRLRRRPAPKVGQVGHRRITLNAHSARWRRPKSAHARQRPWRCGVEN